MIKKSSLGLCIALWGLCLLVACGGDPVRMEFYLEGPCDTCPMSRLDSVLNTYQQREMISGYEINEEQLTYIISFDSSKTRPSDLVLALNEAGYNVGEDLAMGGNYHDLCCENTPELIMDEDFQAEVEINEEVTDLVEEIEADIDLDLEEELDIDLDDPSLTEELDEDQLLDEADVEAKLDEELDL